MIRDLLTMALGGSPVALVFWLGEALANAGVMQ